MAAKAWVLSLAAILVACSASSEEKPAAPAPAPETPAQDEVATTLCDPLAPTEGPGALRPTTPAARASDGTIYAIWGAETDTRVFASEQGVLRFRQITKWASTDDKNGTLFELDTGVTLEVVSAIRAGNEALVPIAVSRGGQKETLTPITADDLAKLEVRETLNARLDATGQPSDGSRLVLIAHEGFSPVVYSAFYGLPSTVTERPIVSIQRDDYGKTIGVTIDVNGSPLTVPVTSVPLGADASIVVNSLSFKCR